MSVLTKKAVDVFAPVQADGTPRQVSNLDAQVWGTELETLVGTEIARVDESISNETQRAIAAEAELNQRIESTAKGGNIGADTLPALTTLAATLGLNNTTDRGKIGRVFSGADKGYYTWSGTAWVFRSVDDLSAVQQVAGNADTKAQFLLEHDGTVQVLGVDNPVAGNPATASTYIHAKEVEGDGVASSLTLYAQTAGTITVGAFSRSSSDQFTRIALLTVPVSVGLNTIPLGFSVPQGCYLGVTADYAGWCAYGATNNIGYFSGTLTGGVMTDSTATTGNRLQWKFIVNRYDDKFLEQLVAESRTTPQIVGKSGSLVTGTGIVAGTIVLATPIKADAVIETIAMFSAVSAPVTIGVYERLGVTCSRLEVLGRFQTEPGVVNTFNIQRLVKKGQFIGFQSAMAAYVTFENSVPNDGYWYDATTTGVSFNQPNNTGTNIQVQARVSLSCLLVGQRYTLGLADVDRIVGLGPSYMAGYYNILGKNWISKVSQFSDYNIEAFAFGGETIGTILDRIRSDNVASYPKVPVKAMRPTYCFIMEGYNSATSATNGVSFGQYQINIKQMIETVRGLGAVPILATEFHPVYDASAHTVYKMLANQYGARFVDLIQNYLKMNAGTPFSDFWQSPNEIRHPGVRTSHIIADIVEREFAQLGRPRNAIKIYRKRSSYPVTPGAINGGSSSLRYSDKYEMTRRFKEILLNQVSLAADSEKYYDELTTGAGAYNQNFVTQSEYLKLQLGQSISIEDYALIDVTIDAINRNVEWFKLFLGDDSLTVYVKDAFVPPYPTDGGPAWKWNAISSAGGIVELSSEQLAGRMDFDKITFLLYKAGGFSLSEPRVEWFGVAGKPEYPKPEPCKAATGAELVPFPATVPISNWTVDGAPAVDTSTTYQLPRGHTGFVVVNATDKIRQTLNYVQSNDDLDVEIRVTARRFPALFASSGTYPSGAPVNQDSFDWRKINVEFLNPAGTFSFIQSQKVGLWWTDVVMRIILPAQVDPLTVRISGDDDIQVSWVSIRCIV